MIAINKQLEPLVAVQVIKSTRGQELADLADTLGTTVKATAQRDGTFAEGDVLEAERVLRAWARNTMERVARFNGENTEEPEIVTPSVKRRGKATRIKIYGFPITAIIRWMGSKGWDFAKAATAVDTLCGPRAIADATIRWQLRAGKKGTSRPAADLTSSQARQIQLASE